MRTFLGFLCVIGLSQAMPSSDFAYSSPSPAQLNGYLPPGSAADYSQGQAPYEAPLISKHFYIHSAPEEEENLNPKRFLLGRPQKNYRVVFIRAPTSSKQRFAAEFAPNEDKTVIYVLAQKEHELDPSDIVTPAPTEPSKPEVFFIKYKTPEEAAHAQQQIQAQYDALGGSSQVSDEGVAPVSSVIGTFGGTNVNTRYLPAARK